MVQRGWQGGSRLTTTPEAVAKAPQGAPEPGEPVSGARPVPPEGPADGAPVSAAIPTAPVAPDANAAGAQASGTSTGTGSGTGRPAPATSSRVRARLARLGGPRAGGPSPVLEPLFRIVRAS